jgi:hypothetical protein
MTGHRLESNACSHRCMRSFLRSLNAGTTRIASDAVVGRASSRFTKKGMNDSWPFD